MDYRCSDPECAGGGAGGTAYAELVARKLGYHCPLCDGPLGIPGLTAADLRIIDRYPLMIARPHRRLCEERHPVVRARLLIDVLTQVLKYLSLVAMSDYLHGVLQDDRLNRMIEVDLGRPLLSTWRQFLERALPLLHEQRGGPRVPEMWPSFDALETSLPAADRIHPPGDLLDDLGNPVPRAGSGLGKVSALINYRNRFSHDPNPPDEVLEQLLAFYLPVLGEVLAALDWCERYPMLKRERDSVVRLMGSAPTDAGGDFAEASWTTDLMLTSDRGDTPPLPLVPLFIVPARYVAAADGLDVLVYDQHTGKRMVYVSPDGHRCETGLPLAEWRRLVTAKQVVLPVLEAGGIEPDEIRHRCERASRLVLDILEQAQGIVDGGWLDRPPVQGPMRAWLKSRQPLLAIGAQAGAGKTALLARMTREWLKAGETVLLLSARDLRTAHLEGELRRELRLGDDLDAANLVRKGSPRDHGWILLLDGVDEHPDAGALLESAISLAERAGQNGALRIGFSFRDEDTRWIAPVVEPLRPLFFCPRASGGSRQIAAGSAGGPSANTATIGMPEDDRAGPFPKLDLPPLTQDERAKLWARTKRDPSRRFRPGFSYGHVYRRSREVADMLRTPALLRVFMEVHSNRNIPRWLTRHSTLEAYTSLLFEICGDQGTLLLDLGRMLLERRSLALGLDELYDDPRTAEAFRNPYVVSPYQRLLRRQVIGERHARDGGVAVSFGLTVVLEHVLGLVVLLEDLGHTPEELAQWLEAHSAYPPAAGVCRSALYTRIEECGPRFLFAFIDQPGDLVPTVAGPVLAERLLAGDDPDQLATQLAEDPTEQDLRTLIQTAVYLEQQTAFQRAAGWLETLILPFAGHFPDSDAWPDLLQHLAELSHRAGDYRRGVLHASRALDHLGADAPPETRARARIHLARCLDIAGRARDALPQLERALAALRGSDDDHSAVMCGGLCELAYTLVHLGQVHRALEVADEARAASDRLPDLQRLKAQQSRIDCLAYLARYDEALPLARRSLDERIAILGEDHPDVADSRNTLAALLQLKGAFAEAASEFEGARVIWERTSGADHPDTMIASANLAGVLAELGRDDEALPLNEQVLKRRVHVLGANHVDVASSHCAIANLLLSIADHEGAARHYRKARAIWERAHGPEHPVVASAIGNQANQLLAMARYEEAAEIHTRVLATRQETLGPEHVDVASSHNSLGATLLAQAEYGGAIEHLDRARSIWEAACGRAHPLVATAISNKAAVMYALARHRQAAELESLALDIRLGTLGSHHPSVASSHNAIANNLAALADHEGAMDHLEKARAIWESAYGPDHPDFATAIANQARLLTAMARYAEANELHTRALGIRLAVLGPGHPDVASSHNSIATALDSQADSEGALHHWGVARGIWEDIYGTDHPVVATVLANMANLLNTMSRDGEALELQERALDIRLTTLEADHPDVATSLHSIGSIHYDRADYPAALDLYRRARAIWEARYGPDHPDVATALASEAGVLANTGCPDEAMALHQRALDVRRRVLGPDHPDVGDSLLALGGLLTDDAKYPLALAHFDRARLIWTRTCGAEHPKTASAVCAYASVLQRTGRREEAKELVKDSLATAVRLRGEDHPGCAQHHRLLGEVLIDEEAYGEALLNFRRAGVVTKGSLGPHHPLVAVALRLEADALRRLDRLDEALAQARHAHETTVRSLGPTHPAVLLTHNLLGLIFQQKGEKTESLASFEQARAILLKCGQGAHPNAGIMMMNEAGLLREMGQPHRALDLLFQARAVFAALDGFEVQGARAWCETARAHSEMGAPESALEAVRQSLDGFAGTPDADLAEHCAAQLLLGEILTALGRHEDALASYEEALELGATSLGPDHPEAVVALGQSATSLFHLGRILEAVDRWDRTIALQRSSPTRDIDNLATWLCNRSSGLIHLGRHAEAMLAASEAVDLLRQEGGDGGAKLASCLNELGVATVKTGDLVGGQRALEQAVEVLVSAEGRDHPSLAAYLRSLGVLGVNLGDEPAAQRHFLEAMRIIEETTGTDGQEMADLCNLMGASRARTGDFDGAIGFLKRAVMGHESHEAADPLDTAQTCNNLAVAHRESGNPARARLLFQRCLDLRKRCLDSGDPAIGDVERALAELDAASRDPDPE